VSLALMGVGIMRPFLLTMPSCRVDDEDDGDEDDEEDVVVVDVVDVGVNERALACTNGTWPSAATAHTRRTHAHTHTHTHTHTHAPRTHTHATRTHMHACTPTHALSVVV
jgi:hypothetical protein